MIKELYVTDALILAPLIINGANINNYYSKYFYISDNGSYLSVKSS